MPVPFFRFGAPPADAPTYDFPPPSTADTFVHSSERATSEGGSGGGGTGGGGTWQPPSPGGAASTSTSTSPRYPRLVWGGTTPNVTLKLRKRLYPLGITRLTAGVDIDVRTAGVAFKWAWTDRLLGARVSLDRHAVALTKKIPVPELAADVELRAALDVHTRRTLLSFAVRPQAGVVGVQRNGIALRQRIPLDKRLDVELFGRVQLPQATFSTEHTGGLSLGEGDFVLHLDHVNMRVLLQ